MFEVRVSPSGAFDNSARDYHHIEARPLASSMGAEIVGADLRALSDDAFAELADALWRHKMIYLRGQRLGHAGHEAFAARFGPFGTDAYTRGVPGHPNVQPIVKEADMSARALFGGSWHTDSAFLPRPPSVTMLRAADVPPYGGDTHWANCALAYRMLSPAMQEMLRPLKVRMSAESNFATQQKLLGTALPFADEEQRRAAIEGTAHPLVRTHQVTGELSLYVDESYAVGIEGMTGAESRPLLDFLCRHILQHGFTCRLRWEPDMIAMWDNRTTLHLGPNDYDGWRREMYRTTTEGEVPA